MPGLGAGHWGYLVILLVIVLIIWGPGKLPDIGSGLGRGIREFRKATSETRDEFHRATRTEDAQPTPVGGAVPAAADRPAGESDHTTAV